MVFCAEFCPWMTDMKEVKEEEEEGLLEKEGFSFRTIDTLVSFCKKKPKIKNFEYNKLLFKVSRVD